MSKFLSHARQPDPVTQAKIDDLLARMTLEEKVGQLVMLSAFAPMDWDQAFREQKLAEQKGETYEFPIKVSPRIIEKIRKGEAGATISAERMVNHEIQRTARHESRLGNSHAHWTRRNSWAAHRLPDSTRGVLHLES